LRADCTDGTVYSFGYFSLIRTLPGRF